MSSNEVSIITDLSLQNIVNIISGFLLREAAHGRQEAGAFSASLTRLFVVFYVDEASRNDSGDAAKGRLHLGAVGSEERHSRRLERR